MSRDVQTRTDRYKCYMRLSMRYNIEDSQQYVKNMYIL